MFFALSLMSVALKSMDHIESAVDYLSDNPTLPVVLEQLQLQGDTKYFGQNIRALSCVNKRYNEFFSDDKRRKSIIQAMEEKQPFHTNAVTLATELKFSSIAQQLNHFAEIIKDGAKEFTQEDKEKLDLFYVNAKTTYSDYLLNYLIIDAARGHDIQSKKLDYILAAGLAKDASLYSGIHTCIEIRSDRLTPNKDKIGYLRVIEQLIAHMSHIDYRYSIVNFTLLMKSVVAADEEVTRLLLHKGANPKLYRMNFLCENDDDAEFIWQQKNMLYAEIEESNEEEDLHNAFYYAAFKDKDMLKKLITFVRKEREKTLKYSE